MEDECTPPYGPQYKSGRPRIFHYGNDDYTLALGVKLPDGSRKTHTFVLPDATPVPDECQLASYAIVGRTAYGYEHLRYVTLQVACNGEDYLVSYDTPDLDRFMWFLLPFFRPLLPYEAERLKRRGYMS